MTEMWGTQGVCGLGAYGLVIQGLHEARDFMRPQRDDAPTMHILVEPFEGENATTSDAEGGAPALGIFENHATLPLLGGGLLRMQRGHDTASFHLASRPSDLDLLHPYLAAAAAVYWQWHGFEAMHAGAFTTDRGAVLLLGPKESGKSTTLAWLATDGRTPVLTDDLAVLRARTVLPGPGAIDLRDGVGALADAGRSVRDGDRMRIRLEPCTEAPLAGIAVLGWSECISIVDVPPPERAAVLLAQRAFSTPEPDPLAMLELVATPMVRAHRPRDLEELPAFFGALVDRFS